MNPEILFNILKFAPPLLVAVILHEVSHGYVAERLGDPTARNMGRITLNPFVHVDLFMTIIVPAVLIFSGSPFIFGGAKPVPINPMYFKNPRRGMAWVALAGPGINFVLAAISALLLFLSDFYTGAPSLIVTLVRIWLLYSVIINIILGGFNLLPIPPLDGGRIAVGFLPMRLARPLAKLERFGILIVIAIIYGLHLVLE